MRPFTCLDVVIMASVLTAVCNVEHVHAQTAPGQEVSDSIADAWREDLDVLLQRLVRIYPRPYAKLSRRELSEARAHLRQRIPDLTDEEIVAEFMRLTGRMLDGHSRFYGATAAGIEARWFPVRLYQFNDGLFIQTISARYADAAGARVLGIGNFAADSTFELVKSVIPGDNEQTRVFRAPYYLMKEWLLAGLGVIEERNRLRLVVSGPRDRPKREIIVTAVEAGEDDVLSYNSDEVTPGGPFIRARDNAKNPVPLHLSRPSEELWLEYLPESRALYARMNRVGRDGEESFGDFVEQLWSLADARPVDKLILDLRHNRGGNKNLAKPLLHGLIRRPHLNRPGHLFVVIGRQTFSAGMMVALELEEHSNALFVGEPTGASPNFASETRGISLPNSGTIASVGIWYWVNSVPWDLRPWLKPDIPTPLESVDYMNNRDPALETILSDGRDFRALADSVVPRRRDELNRVHLAYENLMGDLEDGEPVTELELRDIGRALVNGGDTAKGLDLLNAWVDRYPNSAYALVARGRALMEVGELAQARSDLEEALKLNPEDEVIRSLLAALEE